jgi:hypothetical protein
MESLTIGVGQDEKALEQKNVRASPFWQIIEINRDKRGPPR